MTKINNIEAALNLFEQSRIKQTECIKHGTAKEGNKAYNQSLRAVQYLKKHEALLELKKLFFCAHPAPKYAAALRLLPLIEEESIKVLREVAAGPPSFTRLDAETALKEWAKPDSDLRKFLISQCKN